MACEAGMWYVILAKRLLEAAAVVGGGRNAGELS